MVEIEDIGVVNIGNIGKTKYIDKRLYEVPEKNRMAKRERIKELRFRRRFQIWDI